MNISSSKQTQLTHITTSQGASKELATPSQSEESAPPSLEDRFADEDKRWQEYQKEYQEFEKGQTTRGVLRTGVTAAALGTAGYFLGDFTGVGGALAGGALGLAGGVTVGGLAGSYMGSGKGSSGLAYLGLGVVAGAVVGAVGGGFAGVNALPIAGAVAGGLGGVAVGFYGHQMMEDSAHDKIRNRHGF